MPSKSQQNAILTSEDGEATAQDTQAANDAPVSTSTADSVLSANESYQVVGGVTVIEHQQDSGEANEEHGA